MFLSYKRGTSRGADTYGYTLVTLCDENGKRFRTCGGGYDMLGTVAGEALVYHFGARLLALHKKAETYSQGGKWHTRRAMITRPNGERTLDTSPNYKKHVYGITAHYGDTQKDIKGLSLDGATGFSNVQGIAKLIGVEIKEVYDRSNRHNWKLLGLEFIDTRKAV